MLDRIPKTQDSVSVTLDDGRRYYLSVKDDVDDDDDDDEEKTKKPRQRLLTRSMEELRRIGRERELDRKERQDDSFEDSRDEDVLWVEKYAPKSFSDLLSDGLVNRELLHAIKDWDPFVFQRPAPKRFIHQNTFSQQKRPFNSNNNNNNSNNNDFFKKKHDNSSGNNYRKPSYDNSNYKKPSYDDNNNNKKAPDKNSNFFDKRPTTFDSSKETTSSDPRDTRPMKRVILLCGDPGTGKSTLCRVLAKAAGYRMVEVNASDVRTGGALEEAILDAQQNRSISKGHLSDEPPLVVLEEIDGADAKSAVNAIVALATAALPASKKEQQKRRREEEEEDEEEDEEEEEDDKKAPAKKIKKDLGFAAGFFSKRTRGKDDDKKVAAAAQKKKTPPPSQSSQKKKTSVPNAAAADPPKKKKKKKPARKATKKKPCLLRPLICVCNDAYAPQLRPLREVAVVFNLRSLPQTARVIERLKEVVEDEGLGDVSTAALQSLANASRGDVRACLHALQFASRKFKRDPGLKKDPEAEAMQRLALSSCIQDAVRSGIVKDRVADDFELWRRLFTRAPVASEKRPDYEQAARVALEQEKKKKKLAGDEKNDDKDDDESDDDDDDEGNLGKRKRTADAIEDKEDEEETLDTAERKRLVELLGDVSGVDADRFCTGVYQNYQSARGRDSSMRKTANMAEDLSEVDAAFLGPCVTRGRYDLAKFAAASACAAAFARCRIDGDVYLPATHKARAAPPRRRALQGGLGGPRESPGRVPRCQRLRQAPAHRRFPGNLPRLRALPLPPHPRHRPSTRLRRTPTPQRAQPRQRHRRRHGRQRHHLRTRQLRTPMALLARHPSGHELRGPRPHGRHRKEET